MRVGWRGRTRAVCSHLVAHVWRHRHAAVHGIHVVVRGGTLECSNAVHTTSRRNRDRAVVRRGGGHWRLVLRVFFSIRTRSTRLHRGTRSQGCSSGSGRFFDSAGVVVLVTRQSCATRKGLLAVGVGALVRSLARVDSAVTRKRRRVTEGL